MRTSDPKGINGRVNKGAQHLIWKSKVKGSELIMKLVQSQIINYDCK